MYVGQPIFIVVADTHDNARRAARGAVTYDELPAIFTPQEAKAAGVCAAADAAQARRLQGGV
jgi:xanthine dehydrogenase large subunit